ncbi:hypothetical protein HRI_000992100 [Hibiscus trionum]|uniref:ATP-dependent RNA helicase n=1 Tax=Hibiscus trionum TaxID=183268 RepID=A0A9W7H9M5_HIBTR|nr:hypothetical protein HRI_000992100 [Hibiscus trionum]
MEKSQTTNEGKEEKWSNNSNIKTQTKESKIYPCCSFSSLGLHPTVSDLLRKKFGFEAPTPVQAQAIPVILSGRHVLLNAETGLDKTIAYLAPIIHQLQGRNPRIERSHGTFALVLVPTRELCMQLYEILQQLLSSFTWIVPGCVMDGKNRNKAQARLRKGINILIATPGRLLDRLKDTSFVYTNLRWIVFDEADRILELGFGKDIEEILDVLGSRAGKSVGMGNPSESQRQNLLLSATLNEQVNHLAKISLENPVIGLDNMKMQPESSVYQIGSLGSNLDENLDHSSKLVSSSTGDCKLPAQSVQDRCGTLGDLMCGFNARREAGKRPASESSPSPSPAKKVKAGVPKGEPAFGVGNDEKIASPSPAKKVKAGVPKGEPAFGVGNDEKIATPTATKGIKISFCPSTKGSAADPVRQKTDDVPASPKTAVVPASQKTAAVPAPLPKSGKDGGAEELIGYDWVVKHWPISEVEALRKTHSIDMLKSGVGLLAQVVSANLAAIASMEETKEAMEVVSKEKEELQTKLSVAVQTDIAIGKAQQTDIAYQRLECQQKETMARNREKMIQEMAALQVELERERKEKQELEAKLQKEQLWRNMILEQVYKQGIIYRECALFEVQLKYGPLNLTEIPFEDLRPAPAGFNVFNPPAEALEQQRNRGGNEDATAAVGKNVD